MKKKPFLLSVVLPLMTCVLAACNNGSFASEQAFVSELPAGAVIVSADFVADGYSLDKDLISSDTAVIDGKLYLPWDAFLDFFKAVYETDNTAESPCKFSVENGGNTLTADFLIGTAIKNGLLILPEMTVYVYGDQYLYHEELLEAAFDCNIEIVGSTLHVTANPVKINGTDVAELVFLTEGQTARVTASNSIIRMFTEAAEANIVSAAESPRLSHFGDSEASEYYQGSSTVYYLLDGERNILREYRVYRLVSARAEQRYLPLPYLLCDVTSGISKWYNIDRERLDNIYNSCLYLPYGEQMAGEYTGILR